MRWSYKTVHYELKKEGLLGSAFLDESEMELSLNEYGRAGWELVSVIQTMDGIIAVFKQPLAEETSSLFHIDPVAAEEKENEFDPVEKVSPPVLEDFEVIDSGEELQQESDDEKDSSPDVGAIRIE
ncbi:DUF4177 domain-containing protein [Desulfomarina sp.]